MSVEPRITVYIPSHNYGRFLEQAIESVLSQTVDDWELILIDDGSTDHTLQIMGNYKGHPKIRIIKKGGIGLTAVCNLAANEARGKYLIRLDGDDVFDENILLILGNQLDRDVDLALIFPDFYLMDEDGEVFAHERRKQLHSEDHLMDAPPNGACTMIRLSVLKEIGGYREDLGAQDGFDIWVKLKDRFKTTNVNLPLFYYRRHGKNLTEQPARIVNARRQLKKDATLRQIDAMRPVSAIIPCRKFYDFATDVWKKDVGGKSLLQRNIEICLESSLIDQVIVTCDNEEVGEFVEKFNNSRVRFFPRDERSTQRSAKLAETLKTIVEQIDPEFKGTTIMRYAQTPFISTGTLEEAITSLVVSGADSAASVEEISDTIYRKSSYGLIRVNEDPSKMLGNEKLFRDTSTCIALRNSNLKKGSLRGASMAGFVVSEAEGFFINCEYSLEVANNIFLKQESVDG